MKRLITLAAAIVLGVGSLHAQTSTSTATLGTVRISQAVTADGKALPAGTYQVRLTTVTPPKVVGQTVEETRWIEFLKGGTVAGREVATVVSEAVVREIQDRPRPGGAVLVQTLKGGDYLRVWLRTVGTHYLIHLPKGKM
ncbi:MAG: hypothetical protein ABIP90_11415 [Vicinamibacterales bacterium]